MAVPDFQSFFKPLLNMAADGKEHSIQEARLQMKPLRNLFNGHTKASGIIW